MIILELMTKGDLKSYLKVQKKKSVHCTSLINVKTLSLAFLFLALLMRILIKRNCSGSSYRLLAILPVEWTTSQERALFIATWQPETSS